jgi:hypothetical protein
MEKQEFTFRDFLADVNKDYRNFVNDIDKALTQEGYRIKVESKASGMFVSYSHPKTKRSMLNFLFRKKALVVRLYADNTGKYAGFINSLPESMEKEIAKSSVCKRLVNPADCNPKCAGGYDFSVRKNNYQKCRYSCFQFEVNQESIPVLLEFAELERNERKT